VGGRQRAPLCRRTEGGSAGGSEEAFYLEADVSLVNCQSTKTAGPWDDKRDGAFLAFLPFLETQPRLPQCSPACRDSSSFLLISALNLGRPDCLRPGAPPLTYICVQVAARVCPGRASPRSPSLDDRGSLPPGMTHLVVAYIHPALRVLYARPMLHTVNASFDIRGSASLSPAPARTILAISGPKLTSPSNGLLFNFRAITIIAAGFQGYGNLDQCRPTQCRPTE
jgi:hypothetical protein